MTTKKKIAAKRPSSKSFKRAAKPKMARKASSKMSALQGAAKLLAEAKNPMSCKEMIDAMATKCYWASASGKTPANTLYSAILREIGTKGKEARFKKADRGKFALA